MYKYDIEIAKILKRDITQEVIKLFYIDDNTPKELVYRKVYLFITYNNPQFFKKKSCEEHYRIIKNICDLELGLCKTLTEIGFRGLAKTTLAKLVIVFFLLNNHRKDRGRFYKVISKDDDNARQFVTDIFNLIVSPRIFKHYSFLLSRKNKREKVVERMDEFDLSNGVKIKATTTQRTQRGKLQMENRPDRILFEDIEDNKSVRSIVETQNIRDTIDEAYTSLSSDGRALYNANYVSKRGNIHRLVLRSLEDPVRHRLHIVPIYEKKTGKITWYHTPQEIESIKKESENFDGDYMCDPTNSDDTYFDISYIDMNPSREPILVKDGWAYYSKYNPNHVYVIGADPSGGGGGDFASAQVIDLTLGEAVAEFYDKFTNEEKFGDILYIQGKNYGWAMIGVESNNHGGAVLLQLKHRQYPNIYKDRKASDTWNDKMGEKLGFNTNMKTKPIILSAIHKGINNFALRLPSDRIKAELRLFPRQLVDTVRHDAELGHFDGVMALAIAWEMRKHVGLLNRKNEPLVIS